MTGRPVTVEDFVACFADTADRDLEQFMTWYTQAGTPELVCQLKHDAANQDVGADRQPSARADAGRGEKEATAYPATHRSPWPGWPRPRLTLTSGETLNDGLLEITQTHGDCSAFATSRRTRAFAFRGFSAPANLTIDSRTQISNS